MIGSVDEKDVATAKGSPKEAKIEAGDEKGGESDSSGVKVEDLEDNGGAEALNHGVLLMKNYFSKTFVGEEATKTRSNSKNGVVKRKPPRFSHSLWNHASRYNNMEEVTSNQSESYNSSSKASIPSKANIFSVLLYLQNEESMSRAKKSAAMASLGKKYQEVDFNTWLNSAMAVYEKNK